MMPFRASAKRMASIALTIVEPKALLVKVPEQMKRYDRNVGALNGALRQRPEVFATVGMHVPGHVALGIIDDVVRVVSVKASVGQVGVSVESRAGLT